jgi:hypothetical protein
LDLSRGFSELMGCVANSRTAFDERRGSWCAWKAIMGSASTLARKFATVPDILAIIRTSTTSSKLPPHAGANGVGGVSPLVESNAAPWMVSLQLAF